jgi:hypothetical protein
MRNNLTIVVALVVVISFVLAGAIATTATHDEDFGGETYTHWVDVIEHEQLCVYEESEDVNRVEISNTRHFGTVFAHRGEGSEETTTRLPELRTDNIILWSNGDNALVDELASPGGTCITQDVRCTLILHEYQIETGPELDLPQGITVEPDAPDTMPEPTDDAQGKAVECGLAVLDEDGGNGSDVPEDVDETTDEVVNATDDVTGGVENVTGVENTSDEVEDITGGVENVTGDDGDSAVDRVRDAVDTIVDTVTDAVLGSNETNDSEENDLGLDAEVESDVVTDDGNETSNEGTANETDAGADGGSSASADGESADV